MIQFEIVAWSWNIAALWHGNGFGMFSSSSKEISMWCGIYNPRKSQ